MDFTALNAQKEWHGLSIKANPTIRRINTLTADTTDLGNTFVQFKSIEIRTLILFFYGISSTAIEYREFRIKMVVLSRIIKKIFIGKIFIWNFKHRQDLFLKIR